MNKWGAKCPGILFEEGGSGFTNALGVNGNGSEYIITPKREYIKVGHGQHVSSLLLSVGCKKSGSIGVVTETEDGNGLGHNFYIKSGELYMDLTCDGEFIVTLFNSSGRVIKEVVNGRFVSGEHTIDIGDVADGVYLLKVESITRGISQILKVYK